MREILRNQQRERTRKKKTKWRKTVCLIEAMWIIHQHQMLVFCAWRKRNVWLVYLVGILRPAFPVVILSDLVQFVEQESMHLYVYIYDQQKSGQLDHYLRILNITDILLSSQFRLEKSYIVVKGFLKDKQPECVLEPFAST